MNDAACLCKPCAVASSEVWTAPLTKAHAIVLPVPQLAKLYGEVRDGLERNTYVPQALYSCGDHLIGPLIGSVDEALRGGWAR